MAALLLEEAARQSREEHKKTFCTEGINHNLWSAQEWAKLKNCPLNVSPVGHTGADKPSIIKIH